MNPQIISVFVDQIQIVEGRNPRLTLSGIEDLADSILENGVVTPIKVEVVAGRGKATIVYRLVDGHRRVAACQYLVEHHKTNITIPAIAVDCRDESDALVQMLVSNDSEPFAPFEEAMMFQRLKEEFGLTVEQIAQRCGRSPSHVSDKLALLRADPIVQDAVKNGELTPADANTIIRKSRGDKETQREVTERVLTEGREAVIEKELLRGRMPKAAWNVATTTFDQVWQAALPVGGIKPLLEQTDPVEHISAIPTEVKTAVELAFYMGKMQAFSELSNLTMPELWAKLEERNNT